MKDNMTRRLPAVSTLVILMCCFGYADPAQTAERPDGLAESSIWNAVLTAGQNIRIPAKVAASADPAVEYTWWFGNASNINDAFWHECKEPDLDKKLEFYVDQFGLHGADADLIWMMGSPRSLIQGFYPIPPAAASGSDARDVGFRRVDDIVCKREIERFAKEPAVLDRYYGALLWSGTYFGRGDDTLPGVRVNVAVTTDVQWVKSGLHDRSGEFWPRARSFILLAHSMSRDDLISPDKAKLMANYKTWCDWVGVENFREHLRPDPKRPVWRFDADFGCTEILWPYHAPTKPFPELKRSPRFLFDDLYQDLGMDSKNAKTAMNSSLIQIGKQPANETKIDTADKQ